MNYLTTAIWETKYFKTVLWQGGGKRVKLGISGLLHSRGHVGCPLWLGDAAAQTSLDL